VKMLSDELVGQRKPSFTSASNLLEKMGDGKSILEDLDLAKLTFFLLFDPSELLDKK
jgi:hypothetical protein